MIEEKVLEIYKIFDGLTYRECLDILEIVKDNLWDSIIQEKFKTQGS
ncbi:MAG: hypothetical protein WC332_00435 [Clostridia bacterium]|jgi:hypothetical protein